MSTAVKVLVVDDSATVRAVLRRVLGRRGGIEVVGEASDGAEAIEAARRLSPDLVLMDVEMPGVDGFAAIEGILAHRRIPIVVITSRLHHDRDHTVFEALRRGAVEVFPKPDLPERWKELGDTLPELVVELAGSLESPEPTSRPGADSFLDSPRPVPVWVAVGASTGGLGALRELLVAMGPRVGLAVMVVQHIVAGFEEGLADWLHRETGFDVAIATHGELLQAGSVRLAPRDSHLGIDADGRLVVDGESAAHGGHRPSADVLFSSCARVRPRETVGVVLSGMGKDGAEGLRRLREAGGIALAQDQASSVVFGMPGSALRSGAVELLLPPAELGRTIRALRLGEDS